MNRKQLSHKLAEKTGLEPRQAARALDAALAVIEEQLAAGESLTFQGFLSLRVHLSDARLIRNPRTGIKKMSSPKPRLRVHPSKQFLARILSSPAYQESLRKKTDEAMIKLEKLAAETAGISTPLETPPVAPAPVVTAPPPVPTFDENSPSVRRARTVARVMVKDIFIYHPDLIQKIRDGAERETLLADIFEAARRTLTDRLGQELDPRHDYIAEAFDQMLKTSAV